MLVLQAPVGGIQVTTVLPSPEWSDSYKLRAENRLKRSMSNVVYTYVKNPSNYRLAFKFTLAQGKMLELVAFVQAFYGSGILITDHNGTIWSGYLVNNPAMFEAVQVNEVNIVTLEWEAVKIQ